MKKNIKNKFKNIFKKSYFSLSTTLFLSLLISGCAVDVSLVSILPSTNDEISDEILSREEVDFISGELVTTGSGYQFKGTFGELSEKQSLSNGYTFDGAFYE